MKTTTNDTYFDIDPFLKEGFERVSAHAASKDYFPRTKISLSKPNSVVKDFVEHADCIELGEPVEGSRGIM